MFFCKMRPHRVENEIHPQAPASLQKILPKTQATEAPSADTDGGLPRAQHWVQAPWHATTRVSVNFLS